MTHFNLENISDAQKLSDELLKRFRREDPRTCVVSAATLLMFAVRECREQGINIQHRHVVDLIQTVGRTLNMSDGDQASAAQSAVSELILPGRMF